MDTVSLILGILLIMVVVMFTVLLPVAIIFNVRAGIRYRRALAARVNALRLGSMLTALGIDIDQYLDTVHNTDVNRQMQRCTECQNIEACDEQLAADTIDADHIGFCNNEASLRKLTGAEPSKG